MARVKSFTRKGGVRVHSFTRRNPHLSPAERRRRAGQARRVLLPAAIKFTGKKGFRATEKALEGKPGITNPVKLAGWLKGQAKARGELSSKHPYVGRKGYRKYPAAAKRMSPKAYKAYLRKHR